MYLECFKRFGSSDLRHLANANVGKSKSEVQNYWPVDPRASICIRAESPDAEGGYHPCKTESSLHADKVKEYNREQMGIVLYSMVFPLFTDALRREMRAILIVIFK